ncbi:MAG: glycine--tRNA ligase subunit beta [Gammaproteobacteria bacterium]|nr:glycine--tRNA ligase subunit beta [Gammaproteobacteria bacterium]
MITRELLIEIGTEELPPHALLKLSQTFEKALLDEFQSLNLSAGSSTAFATPRRLAVRLNKVPETQSDRTVEKRGPAVQAAFDKQGQPTPAATGFARSCGVEVDALKRLKNENGEWLFFEKIEPGRKTKTCLAEIIERALAALPIPKRMRWGAGEAEFVRPVHWVVILFGEEVIEVEILGIKSDCKTYGHRFHHPQAIELKKPGDYEDILQKQGKVIPLFAQRRAAIEKLVVDCANSLKGVIDLKDNDELLDEVTALVEWPVSLICSFDESFLRVPAEALVSTMKDNQKYFPIYDKKGKLTRNFIVISNIESGDPSQIRSGNERVVRPRLADAMFFWDQDRKKSLEQFNERLREVIFQRNLGTTYEKVERVSVLAGHIASLVDADVLQAKKAGLLCKADLMTNMVFEFPKLQGIMGRYYAQHGGEVEEVASAIEEHYLPRYAGDRLPATKIGQCVALADKLDTLLGIFAAGEKPSGVRDPFALRRAALGVLKIIIEKKLDLDLNNLLKVAASSFTATINADDEIDAVLDFMLGRLKAEYESGDNAYTPQQVAAVMSCKPTRPIDFDRRIKAVRDFSALPEADALSAANKRTANILKKAKINKSLTLDVKLLHEPAEKDLYSSMNKLLPEVEPLCQKGEYARALKKLAGLRKPVDRFFDEVMVMAEDKAIQANRLALLGVLQNAFTQIADISQLQN